jgi:hypothetical protein
VHRHSENETSLGRSWKHIKARKANGLSVIEIGRREEPFTAGQKGVEAD